MVGWPLIHTFGQTVLNFHIYIHARPCSPLVISHNEKAANFESNGMDKGTFSVNRIIYYRVPFPR